jgi:crotonobetainyl-CoA:carnitine CoA-transferase CaiB-like acyl-CoA transferase
MPRVLEGIRVLDFGQYIAGPLTAMLLADQGASVTRVDPPAGPRWTSPANATLNRGKACTRLDLRDAADLRRARAMLASADVLIENFRPGVMERLGLGHPMALAANPRLIYCSLPGFAADHPRAEEPGWEGVIGAATDMYRGDPPHFTSIPISSHFAAFQAAVSIAMALVSRERDGLGQRIEVPLFDATFAAIGAHGLFVDGAPGGVRPDDFWTGLFECGDKRWVQVSAATPRFRRCLAGALQLESWEANGLFDVDRLAASPTLQADLRQRQIALFASQSAQMWEDLGGKIGVPIIKCRSTAEWVATDHARKAGIVRDVDGAVQPGAPIRMGDVTTGGAESHDLRLQPGGALAGVRVLDLTQVLAGPTGGRTLAEFGADVIKVNNPHEEGAGIHFSRHRYHTDVNRGKRSILLDLKTPQGQSVLRDLIERADILLQNFRPDAAERLGVRYADVRTIRPDIVYVTVSAFGQPGPWTGWPGYEVQAQAAAGLRYSSQGKPEGQPFAVNDYGTGLLAAYAAALGVFQRQRTGAGQSVEAALAYTATILQTATLGSEPAEAAMAEVFRAHAGSRARTSIDVLMHDPWVVAHGLSLTREHDTGEVITSVGPAARLSRTPVQPGRPAPSPGADAAAIMRELGRESELDELLRLGIVAIERARPAAG